MVRKNGLPRRVYERHGAWHFVDLLGKWHKLCRVSDGVPAMYRALAQLQDAQTGDRMPAVIASWLTTKRPGWSVSQRRNIERVAGEVSAAFAEFRPGDVTTPDCAEYLQTLSDRPRTHNVHRDAGQRWPGNLPAGARHISATASTAAAQATAATAGLTAARAATRW